MQRFVEIGDWIYEVKLVKAIKTPAYGQPYTAICHFNFIDDRVTMESMLSRDKITNFDMLSHAKFLASMSVSALSFTRYKHGKPINKTIKI